MDSKRAEKLIYLYLDSKDYKNTATCLRNEAKLSEIGPRGKNLIVGRLLKALSISGQAESATLAYESLVKWIEGLSDKYRDEIYQILPHIFTYTYFEFISRKLISEAK